MTVIGFSHTVWRNAPWLPLKTRLASTHDAKADVLLRLDA